MDFTVYKIITLKDEDDLDSIKEYFNVDELDEIEHDELAEYLAEEYHHEDLEDYKSFECESGDLDSDEAGYKADKDADDEGYLVLISPKKISLRYYKRSEYL